MLADILLLALIAALDNGKSKQSHDEKMLREFLLFNEITKEEEEESSGHIYR